MTIVQKIEKMRVELVEKGMTKGLQNPDVIKLSQELDKLINNYYKVGKEK